MRLAIVLLGDHGGELDRLPCEVKSGQDASAVIGEAVINAIGEWTLNPGDTIRIETVEG